MLTIYTAAINLWSSFIFLMMEIYWIMNLLLKCSMAVLLTVVCNIACQKSLHIWIHHLLWFQ
jgi:hypothetical protein